MMDVSLTDVALELLKLLEKGAKHTPDSAAFEQVREHRFAMGSPLKTHITQKGARHLAELNLRQLGTRPHSSALRGAA